MVPNYVERPSTSTTCTITTTQDNAASMRSFSDRLAIRPRTDINEDSNNIVYVIQSECELLK